MNDTIGVNPLTINQTDVGDEIDKTIDLTTVGVEVVY